MTIGILLGISRAYDKVSYKILLTKLYGIGVKGLAHKWFQLYLSDRKQYVQIKFHNSYSRLLLNVESITIRMLGSISQANVLG